MTMASNDELKTHQEMWVNFTKLMFRSAAGAAVILILLALFLL